MAAKGKRRDFQKSKVYAAERNIDPGKEIMNIHDLTAYCKKIVNSKRFQKKFPRISEIIVKDGRWCRSAHGWRSGWSVYIQMPRWSRKQIYILHEIAHGLAPYSHHNEEFCGAFMWLVRTFMGLDAFNALQTEFDKVGILYEEKLWRA